MKPIRSLMLGAATMLCATTAHAQLVQTFGSGSAVTTVDAMASFESLASLFDNPYSEGGMSFSRTSLSLDNNTCGFAGCLFSFPGVVGNYMYGVGDKGFFSMFAAPGQSFKGLEFILGSGYGGGEHEVSWNAYLLGSLVGSGSTIATMGTVIGFSDATGFDQLDYTDTFGRDQAAPAFDEVRAQYTDGVIGTPEPASLALIATGFVGLVGMRRRMRKATA